MKAFLYILGALLLIAAAGAVIVPGLLHPG